MSFSTKTSAFFSHIVSVIWSYLAQVICYFVSLLGPSRQPPELPVSVPGLPIAPSVPSKGPFAFIYEYIKDDKSSIGPPRDHLPPIRDLEANYDPKEWKIKRTTHAERSKAHELVQVPLNSPITKSRHFEDKEAFLRTPDRSASPSANSVISSLDSLFSPAPSVSSSSTSSTPSLAYSPQSSACSPSPCSTSELFHLPAIPASPTPHVLPSVFGPDCAHPYGKRLLSGSKVGADIGELGKRRGFKGAPLFTPTMAKKSTFLSLPSPSPRTASSRLHFTIPSSPKSPKSPKHLEAPLELQDAFDDCDPFATSATSFFAPSVSAGSVPTANLYNFDPYIHHETPPARTPSLKRKLNYENLRTAVSPTKRATMGTTLYNAMGQVGPVGGSGMTPGAEVADMSSPARSPRIVLTPPSPAKARCASVGGGETEESTTPTAEHLSTDILGPPLVNDDDAFFASDPLAPPPIPPANLYDFSAYGEPTTNESPSLKKKPARPNHHTCATKTAKPGTLERADIYDLDIYDLDIYGLAKEMKTESCEETTTTTPPRKRLFLTPPKPAPAHSRCGSFPVGERVSGRRGVGSDGEDPFADGFVPTRRGLQLRPLLLKASRFHEEERVQEMWVPPCARSDSRPRVRPQGAKSSEEVRQDRQSQRLDDIIALLDMDDSDSTLGEEEEEVSYVKESDSFWDSGPLMDTYAL